MDKMERMTKGNISNLLNENMTNSFGNNNSSQYFEIHNTMYTERVFQRCRQLQVTHLQYSFYLYLAVLKYILIAG